MANLNFNKIMIGGRLTTDPETKNTSSGALVATFTVAVNRKTTKGGEQQTDFFRCTAWQKTAEFVSKYFRRGSSIFVCGEAHGKRYVTSSGDKRESFEVNVDEVHFVDSKEKDADDGAQSAQDAQSADAPRNDDMFLDVPLGDGQNQY